MPLTSAQKKRRAEEVHAIGLEGSDALRAVVAKLMALGEIELAKALGPAQVMLRAPIAQRVNELQGFEPKRRALVDNSEHVRELRGEYGVRNRPVRARPKPPVHVRLAHDSVERLRRESLGLESDEAEVLDAG
jgi:hypothetical protein